MKPDFCAMEGRFVRLEPVTPEVKEQVRALVESDPEAWTTLTVNPMVQGFDVYWLPMIEGAATGQRHAYVIRRISEHRVIGTLSLMSMRLSQRGVEIGATFLHPDARGGYANPECKLLMLDRAFNSGAVRVEFVVDSGNHRSQGAVLKLGAVREGLLRNRKIAWNGEVRDVAFFSITEKEWPGVGNRLRKRLSAFGTSA
jgi:RimJ/RimL family protein N-acetyltransferase